MKNINNNNNKPFITATLKYKTSSTHDKADEVSVSSSDINQHEDDVLSEVFRLESVEAIRKAMNLYKLDKVAEAQDLIK